MLKKVKILKYPKDQNFKSKIMCSS